MNRASVLIMFLCISVFAELKVLDKPMWVFPGQRFRVCIEQQAGAGRLEVDVPSSLRLFDRWDKDWDQRFYFTAEKPGTVKLSFSGAAGKLEVPIEVIAWADLYTSRKLGKLDLPRIWPMGEHNREIVKTKRTLLSEQEYAEIIAANKSLDSIKKWLAKTDEQMFNIVPGPAVPRTCLIVLSGIEGDAIGKGCPVCGTEIYNGRSGFYPWQFEPEKNPWKVKCPSCKTYYPSNDWAAGDMHSGDFPDDGFGCQPVRPIKDSKGRVWRWPFIAYYHQWQGYMRELAPAIRACAKVGAATGDRNALRKAAIGLFRYAESMLDMSVNMNHRKIPNRDGILWGPVGAPKSRDFSNPQNSFLYIQPNWDTPIMEKLAEAWELIFDKLDEDEGLIKFCQEHYHPEIQNIKDFKRFMDAGVIRVQIQACMDNAIGRNYPQQESTAATLALTLGTPDIMKVADWLLNDVGIRFALTNEYYKDGAAHESPGYNSIQIRDMARLFGTLDKIAKLYPDLYKPPRFVSPQNDPKFRRQYDFPLEFGLIGRTYPEVGDTGKAKPPAVLPQSQGYPCDTKQWLDAYKLTGDQRFLQALYGPRGNRLKYVKDPEIAALAKEAGERLGWQVVYPSNILDGYGHVFLRSGEEDSQRAIWMRYARVPQHAHYDMLTWGMAAIKRDILPELGYPEGWTYSRIWEAGWGTHYGSRITNVSSDRFLKAELTAFSPMAPAQVAVAETRSNKAGAAECRERTVILVDTGRDSCYALTLERVFGGAQHTCSFHCPEGTMKTDAVFAPFQGTVLGEGLKYGDFSSTRIKGADKEYACLAFMFEPAKAVVNRPWMAEVALKNQKNASVRIFSISPRDAVTFTAKGEPPGGNKSLYKLDWIVVQANGTAPLASQFMHVVHPYEGKPVVQRLEQIPVQGGKAEPWEPIAVKIHCDGFTDTVLLQQSNTGMITAGGISCDGIVGFWREAGGKCLASAVLRGTSLKKDQQGISLPSPYFQAKVASCDWGASTVTLDKMPPADCQWAGRHVRIFNDFGSSASYIIKKVLVENGSCKLQLDLDPRIGESFVDSFADSCIVGKNLFRMRHYGYYNGKTVAREDGKVFHCLKKVDNYKCLLLDKVTREQLMADFKDCDGDGLIRFIVYDFGPGDSIHIDNFAAME